LVKSHEICFEPGNGGGAVELLEGGDAGVVGLAPKVVLLGLGPEDAVGAELEGGKLPPEEEEGSESGLDVEGDEGLLSEAVVKGSEVPSGNLLPSKNAIATPAARSKRRSTPITMTSVR
jgi:hypothetical protein